MPYRFIKVFGDGSVVCVSAPGHSLGHQVLFVDLLETGPVILGTDLYITQHMRENYLFTSYTTDKKSVIKSFILIDDLLEQTGVELWLNHDKLQNDEIRHAPLFYK